MYLNPQRRSRDVNTVELHVDVVNPVLPGHEPDGVLVAVDVLDEAVVRLARRCDHLRAIVLSPSFSEQGTFLQSPPAVVFLH